MNEFDITEMERELRSAASTTADDDRAAAAASRLADRAAAEGLLDLAYATVDSPLGELVAVISPRGLVRLAYAWDGEDRRDQVLETLARRISPRLLEAPARLDPVRRELDEYFDRRRREFDLAIDWTLVGPFGRRVLSATAAIPYGEVSTYAALAAAAGSPRGARAAGNALGSNPVPIVVPCHRALRSGGALGGYTGGLDRKRFLLGLEGVLPGEL
jgi:methylated-DNA-[protein]-cysteine S-methyltransferase